MAQAGARCQCHRQGAVIDPLVSLLQVDHCFGVGFPGGCGDLRVKRAVGCSGLCGAEDPVPQTQSRAAAWSAIWVSRLRRLVRDYARTMRGKSPITR